MTTTTIPDGHGRNGYRRGCRCDECRAANTAAARNRRASATPPKHGTASAYFNHGCRCEACTLAGAKKNAQVVRLRRERIAAGARPLSHGARAYEEQGCRCEVCRAANVRKSSRAMARLQAKTRATASRHGQIWTGPELEMLSRRDLSAQDLAKSLGRTVQAVRTARRRLTRDPMFVRLAGVARLA